MKVRAIFYGERSWPVEVDGRLVSLCSSTDHSNNGFVKDDAGFTKQ